MQRIFQKEESSSTSSIMNLPLDTRTRRRLCGKNPKDMQTNTQDYHSEKDADKKTYNEMSVRKTQPKQGKDFYNLFDKWVLKGEKPEVSQQHYVMGVLIRGGVFGESGKE